MEGKIKELAYLAVEAAEDKKAEDIQLLEVGELTIIADYFVICSGSSERQVEAIARGVEDKLGPKGITPRQVAGKDNSRWIVMDYADFMVHIFHNQERKYYELDRLWADAEQLLSKKG